jgi:hypothetical protein
MEPLDGDCDRLPDRNLRSLQKNGGQSVAGRNPRSVFNTGNFLWHNMAFHVQSKFGERQCSCLRSTGFLRGSTVSMLAGNTLAGALA